MTQIAAALFDWDAVEARSDLERFFLVRDHLPDSDLIAALEAKRGLGRDDYPVIPMRGVAIFAKDFSGHPARKNQQKCTRPPMPSAAPIRPRHLVSTQQGVET